MKRDYSVSYRSGWMTKGNVYDIKNIEGGQDTAKRLVDSGYAVRADDASPSSYVPEPKIMREQRERVEKTLKEAGLEIDNTGDTPIARTRKPRTRKAV